MNLASFSPLVQMIEHQYHSEGIDDGGWVATEDSMGDETAHVMPHLGGAVLVAALVLVAGTSYVAGRAMAPRPQSKNAYGIGGAVLGTVLGPVGLGILGAVALSGRR